MRAATAVFKMDESREIEKWDVGSVKLAPSDNGLGSDRKGKLDQTSRMFLAPC